MFLNVYIRTDNLRYRKETLMPDDVDTLETKRSQLLEEFLSLGDLRPGSLTAVMRRCGKPSCHCAKRNDPGHDPQFRLTRRVAGKTVTETFPNPTALRKAQQEVTEFHRFQKLSQDLVALAATGRLDGAGKKKSLLFVCVMRRRPVSGRC